MRLFCGNLNWYATESEVKMMFSEFGPVDSVTLCFYPDGNRRSFCFIEMLENENALKAIINLDGKEFKGRKLVVQKAESKDEFKNDGAVIFLERNLIDQIHQIGPQVN